MREIKYRGHRQDIGWKYGYLTVVEDHEGRKVAIKLLEERYITYVVNPESVGESTGRLDKNGNEVYEGDRVRYKHTLYETLEEAVVEWDEEYCGFDPFIGAIYPNYYNLVEVEVIGNIYENSDLLT